MLPPRHRLRRSQHFRQALRHGRPARGRLVVVHMSRTGAGDQPALVGFAVARSVGDAVTRNRVRRRLRHLVREDLAHLPTGSMTVVRALPAAATSDWASLRDDLHRTLGRAMADPR